MIMEILEIKKTIIQVKLYVVIPNTHLATVLYLILLLTVIKKKHYLA